MKNILIIVGTRPELIKMLPVYQELKNRVGMQVKLILTGQHREMLRQVLDIFDLTPDVDLDLMSDNQSLSKFASKSLSGIDSVIQKQKTDLILVHGDTSTTLSGALAAYFNRIPIGHVEAGLRTGDLYAPWPEEGNRKTVGSLTTLHFAPTKSAQDNLLAENITPSNIFVTGNTVVDAILLADKFIGASDKANTIDHTVLNLDTTKKIILVTGHRRENFGQGLEDISNALLELSKEDNVEIVYPLHMNPIVKKVMMRKLAGQPNIHLLEPLDYLSFIYLMKISYFILTDSGGIQEEAPSFGKPVLVMRDKTERPEAVKAGIAKLVGTSSDTIVESARFILNSEENYKKMSGVKNPYGDGRASQVIVDMIENYLN